MRRLSFGVVLGLLLALFVCSTVQADSIKLIVNGVTSYPDAQIINGRTCLPISLVGNAVGVTNDNIIWDAPNQTVTIMKGDKVIQMKIGSYTLLVNGEAVSLDVPPTIINGRTYLPVASIGKALGVIVTWDGANNAVVIGAGSSGDISSSKKIYSESDLPVITKATNGMQFTVNSYYISNTGIKFNVTLTNSSSTSNKGQTMTSTWQVYDGKKNLKFIGQDQIFYDTQYLHSGQSITGNIMFAGLSNSTSYITLEGGLWQYIDKADFSVSFYVPKSSTLQDSSNNTGTNTQKDTISKSDLPYTINASNGMSMKINKYTINSNGISLNVTFTNNSSVMNKGNAVIGCTYEIYDGKNTLKFIDQDQCFYDVGDLRCGQSVTGDIYFEGLSNVTDKITLSGDLVQGVDYYDFEINIKV
ncbi:MAG: copper amine oxidase N-terminal domain-containing protein [Syntrophomonas sp.]